MKIKTKRIDVENERDIFEQELDYLIDVADARKTVNERQIVDEKRTSDERRKILDEARNFFVAILQK